ncbi:MAG: hypothetical protein JXR88_05790 [Clostridia bacterium]|nr:hypothetical protein [Clostridia bacterium]
MLEKLLDRRHIVVILIFVLFGALALRLADLTIIQGEAYREKADESFQKRMTISAKRGEIYDANGILLAGNIPSYTVQFLDAPQYADQVNEVSVNLLTLLEEKNETYLDFPIQYIGEGFFYTNEINTQNWLLENGFQRYTTAQEVYDQVRLDNYIDVELNNYDAQTLLLYKGISLPISVKSMKFLADLEKENFLKYYGLDPGLTAKEAFEALKKHRKFKISENYSVEDALKIMTVRHAFNLSGYYSYIPTDIAKNVSKETAVLIQERTIDFPGVSIVVEPIRDYPFGSSAAHVLGYLGKISTSREIEKYIDENKYSPDDLIGKTGLENTFEDVLHGEDGYKFVYADAKGNYIGDVLEGVPGKEPKTAYTGKDIQLTIDIELQQKLESMLEYTLGQIQIGGTYESPWGNMKYDQFEHAQTGAGVIIKVDTGEVLAMASYPSYDPNLFSTGISMEDWNNLQPENSRNPLAPRPLYNIAANTSVQPGSTFKPMTILTALEQGLDPNAKLFTNGAVEVGNRLFQCWIYREQHRIHGAINAMDALKVSCNYFMFDAVRGFDYYRNKSLGYEMSTDILMDYSQRFGLGEYTGIEIHEDNKGLPSEEIKVANAKYSLRRFLSIHLKEYFSEEKLKDEDYKDLLLDTIVGWTDEYMEKGMTRNEITRRLMALQPVTTQTETELLTDYILYSYFMQIPWREGDDLNLSIGQGEHRYTILQIARYISAIANDGYLNELTLIKTIDGELQINEATERIVLNDYENLAVVREGMRRVNDEPGGSMYSVFKNFPIESGGKTGTAQKEGRIPPVDEVEYLREFLDSIVKDANYGVSKTNESYITITPQELEDTTNALMEVRNEEVAALQLEFNAMDDSPEKMELGEKIEDKATNGYLEQGTIMREALKILGGEKITDELIDAYRQEYDPYAWVVSFAPFEDPEICIAVMVPQGGHSYYTAPMVRDLFAEYFGLVPETEEE